MKTKLVKKQKKQTSDVKSKKQTRQRMTKEFVVISYTREDLERAGYNTSDVSDEMMRSFAHTLQRGFEKQGADAGDYEEFACGEAGIPKRVEQPTA